MSDLIVVDHPALQQAAADLARAVAASEERIERLAAELAPLNGQWYGSAQEAYLEAKAVWESAQGEMRLLLARLGAAVGAAQEAYRGADQAGARAFR
ncbi:WXG100 family type VII secretion target [Nocardioides sp. CER19]|uniref:WXG100 family type VII secretion target n=1 Tax=Nocardioides sp. CER19 TaxID=3038538 RepID=UPI00244A6067|nr:WXG100 family type VII secretion target [Nocardioides sp. CER19]MDH2412639.1 WXG100 family type VII secretion target [Nocardioides sp. CER19]